MYFLSNMLLAALTALKGCLRYVLLTAHAWLHMWKQLWVTEECGFAACQMASQAIEQLIESIGPLLTKIHTPHYYCHSVENSTFFLFISNLFLLSLSSTVLLPSKSAFSLNHPETWTDVLPHFLNYCRPGHWHAHYRDDGMSGFI